MEKPLISIIIPTFNRVQLISETLDSVLAQTYTNWECLIVDDHSTDKIDEVISEYLLDSRFSFYKRPVDRKKGGCACRNFGYELSKGKYVIWLDSDDLLTKDSIDLHLKAFFYNPHIDVVVCKAQVFQDEMHNIIRDYSKLKETHDILHEMITNNSSWAISAPMWKKASLPINPFNENLYSSQEWTFHLEMLINNVKYIYIDAVAVLIREHSQRMTRATSALKTISRFYTRHIIFKKLALKKKLTTKIERDLIRQMFMYLRVSLKNNYITNVLKMILMLFKLLKFSKFKKKILKAIFIASPIYYFSKKGVRLFF